jgi:hypothetical protein
LALRTVFFDRPLALMNDRNTTFLLATSLAETAESEPLQIIVIEGGRSAADCGASLASAELAE